MILRILYQDDRMVAVDKPAGVIVHRSELSRERRNILKLLRNQIGKWVYPVHRLDRAASGVLLFALDPEMTALMSAELKKETTRKEYLAWVRGWVDSSEVLLDQPLRKTKDSEPRPARTFVRGEKWVEIPEPVGKYASARYTRVRARIETGRFHQIRRHLSGFSHPILGDSLHGDGKHNTFIRNWLGLGRNRLFLFSEQLSFLHPLTGVRIEIQAPMPKDFLFFEDRTRAFERITH